MTETNGNGRSPLRLIFLALIVVILPLAVGLYAAPRLVAQPKVGVIRLSYDIFSGTAYEITEQLNYALEHDDIKAVVLIINSPGGSAAYSEELYLAVLNTREKIPVVASIDLLAASGAYYMAAAANEIYAKPTSNVGSVGVIATLPTEVYIEEDLLTTGPYKAFGGTRDGSVRQIERAKFAFLEAVSVGRDERLKISLDDLSRAEIYTGVQAWEYGLVDDLISTEEAISRAADMARVKNYEVVELYPLTFNIDATYLYGAYQPQPLNVEQLWAPPTNWPAGLYYRYIVPASH
ncbi:MAG: S49 family peptidase [Anaerolineales bacterium]|nr:S49 family peptidase [Anaerolineales bacterium]MCB8992002.1 S49 family peptidase [Ardenticatenaceae bacterium]MCB9004600.1 S49 family peptidase [Ardenticatenaceae bacterium]